MWRVGLQADVTHLALRKFACFRGDIRLLFLPCGAGTNALNGLGMDKASEELLPELVPHTCLPCAASLPGHARAEPLEDALAAPGQDILMVGRTLPIKYR